MSERSKQLFLSKLLGDVALLEELGLMDYSLLVFVLKSEGQAVRELAEFLQNYAGQVICRPPRPTDSCSRCCVRPDTGPLVA